MDNSITTQNRFLHPALAPTIVHKSFWVVQVKWMGFVEKDVRLTFIKLRFIVWDTLDFYLLYGHNISLKRTYKNIAHSAIDG